ncbi:MAG: T9SS type A sorting domain-containing protein [Cytophagales bacterium]|nr:T9SS type A sorting domain-containing protein [Cytophagales bacterium]
MQQWIYDNWGTSVDNAADELIARLGTGPFLQNDINQNAQDRYWHFHYAQIHDVPVITYEGGDHINAVAKVDTDGDGSNDTKLNSAIPASVDFIHQLVRHPKFYTATKNWWARHTASGLVTNVPFVLVSNWSQYGQWGMMEYLGQPITEAQEYRATLDHYNLPYPDLSGSRMEGLSQGTPEVSVATSTLVFPNPAAGFITAVAPGAAQVSVAIFDASGQQVASASTAGESLGMDLSSLAAGLYVVSVNGQRSKLMVE